MEPFEGYQRDGRELLVCNHVTKQPCWGSIQQNFCTKNLHENAVELPEERNAFILDQQFMPPRETH